MEIRQNALEELWPLEVRCSDCGSLLLVELEDLQFDNWKVFGYEFDGTAKFEYKYNFECLVCGKLGAGNEVDKKLIPLNARRELGDESKY